MNFFFCNEEFPLSENKKQSKKNSNFFGEPDKMATFAIAKKIGA